MFYGPANIDFLSIPADADFQYFVIYQNFNFIPNPDIASWQFPPIKHIIKKVWPKRQGHLQLKNHQGKHKVLKHACSYSRDNDGKQQL